MCAAPLSGNRVRRRDGSQRRELAFIGIGCALLVAVVLTVEDERTAEQALISGAGVLLFAAALGSRLRPAWFTLGATVIVAVVLMAACHLEADHAPGVLVGERLLVQGAWLTLALMVASRGAAQLSALHRGRELVREYRVLGTLGEGANCEVFEAEHPTLSCRVALAVVREGRAGRRSTRTFERAMDAASRLDHPAIVRVFEHGMTSWRQGFYAMELVRGVALSRVIELTGPMPAPRVVHILRQVCSGVAHLHAKGLVHRDLKPDNVLLLQHGFDLIKVVDLCRLSPVNERGTQTEASASSVRQEPFERVFEGRLQVGGSEAVVCGNPLFLAPEAILNPESADARSDVYALAATAYYLLTGGAPPLPATSARAAIERQLHDIPERPRIGDGGVLPRDLSELVLKCLSKHPDSRPSDAAALEAELASCADADGWSLGEARAWWAEHTGVARRPSLRGERPIVVRRD